MNDDTPRPADHNASHTRSVATWRAWSISVAIGAVVIAAVMVVFSDLGKLGPVAVPRAAAQPAPTGPTGGPGGGLDGPPAFPMQPPPMPSGPPAPYNSGSYPAPDQSNGISIYNSEAQAAPSAAQPSVPPGQNPDGTWQTAANGEHQPLDHGPAPYTGTQSIPNTAPTQPQHGPQPSPSPTQQPSPQQANQTPVPRTEKISKSSLGDPYGVAGSENECYSHRAYIPGQTVCLPYVAGTWGVFPVV
ncbi:hypothetical protein D2E80_22260 [Mycobacteroides abscessus]|nr:hypothetical protein D2E80_22260 [Mycobacteroides abscessus]SKT79168.1 Uncharacterised protein [Mycobacteroides abscessus subsp. massiliense]SKU02705.1 Uncharacterised protein [Mycobacteroides abscessus subsp. massiliense]